MHKSIAYFEGARDEHEQFTPPTATLEEAIEAVEKTMAEEYDHVLIERTSELLWRVTGQHLSFVVIIEVVEI